MHYVLYILNAKYWNKQMQVENIMSHIHKFSQNFLLLFLQWRVETQAAADRSHMLPCCSALQRCQTSLKEWSASLLCYPTIMCLTFPWQRCHSTSPPSFQLEGPCPPSNKTFCSQISDFKPLKLTKERGDMQYLENKINCSSAKNEMVLELELPCNPSQL